MNNNLYSSIEHLISDNEIITDSGMLAKKNLLFSILPKEEFFTVTKMKRNSVEAKLN